jgi:ribosomal protein L29
MKIKELRKKGIETLPAFILEQRKELFTFRTGLSGGKIRNVKSARALRRTVAQALTLLRETGREKGRPHSA